MQYRKISELNRLNNRVAELIVPGSTQGQTVGYDLASLQREVDAKQDKLKAGAGITINGSKISTTYKIWHGTKSQYDAIFGKDDYTIYFIEEES